MISVVFCVAGGCGVSGGAGRGPGARWMLSGQQPEEHKLPELVTVLSVLSSF